MALPGGRHYSGSAANIHARILEDTRLREAAQSVQMQRRLDAWAVWQGNNKAYHHKQETNRKAWIKDELACANKELLLVRRANLRDLLEAEHAALEKELGDMGLAIVRNDLH
ncbi:Protein of unknown function (DUF4558) [Plasmodiophora brassicae]